MKQLIRSLLVLSLPVLAAACSVSSESKTCTYNNVPVSCEELDRELNRTAPEASPTPAQGASGSQVADCVTASVSTLSQADAQRLCSENTALAQCVVGAVGPLSQEDAERICRN